MYDIIQKQCRCRVLGWVFMCSHHIFIQALPSFQLSNAVDAVFMSAPIRPIFSCWLHYSTMRDILSRVSSNFYFFLQFLLVWLIPQYLRSHCFALSFIKESCAKKIFRGKSPRSRPRIMLRENIRAIRVAILLCHFPEMKFAGTWWRLSTTMQRLLRIDSLIIDITLFKKR